MKNRKRSISISLSILFLLSLLIALPMSSQKAYSTVSTEVSIDPSLQYQTFDGWGTSLAWWADLVGKWKTNAKNQIIDLLFDPDKGLGLNMVRYNIGGGENPAHNHMRLGGQIEGYEPAEGKWNWDADAGQRWVLQEAKKKIVPKEFKAEAFSNSPPYWMTISQCASGEANGQNNLKDNEYDRFADYFTEVIKHFRDSWGITFSSADPLNEPKGGWWKANGSQEGCNFNINGQNRILDKVADALVQKGLTSTKLSASDENSLDFTIDTLNTLDKSVLAKIGLINTHAYSGNKRTQLRDLAATLGKPLYMDEVCTGNSDHDHNDMQNGLAIADYIFQDLRDMKVTGWDIWQGGDDEEGNAKANSNWGLIHAYWTGKNAEKFFLTTQYYAMAHFTRFIRPGYTLIDANNSNVIAAYDAPTNKLVLVVRNGSADPNTFKFKLSSFNCSSASIKAYQTDDKKSLADISKGLKITNGTLSGTLPSCSMATYVISNAKYTGEVGHVVNDNVLGVGSDQFNYSITPAWSCNHYSFKAYSGDVHLSSEANASMRMKFTGTGIKLFGTKSASSGIAAVSIDNGPETPIDLYADKNGSQLIYTSQKLEKHGHMLHVRVTGTKNPKASDCTVEVDKAVIIQ